MNPLDFIRFAKEQSFDHIFEEGKGLYKTGSVTDLISTDQGFEAKVFDSEEYRVQIYLKRNQPVPFCTCPYDKGSSCTHIVAVYLTIAKKVSLNPEDIKEKGNSDLRQPTPLKSFMLFLDRFSNQSGMKYILKPLEGGPYGKIFALKLELFYESKGENFRKCLNIKSYFANLDNLKLDYYDQHIFKYLNEKEADVLKEFLVLNARELQWLVPVIKETGRFFWQDLSLPLLVENKTVNCEVTFQDSGIMKILPVITISGEETSFDAGKINFISEDSKWILIENCFYESDLKTRAFLMKLLEKDDEICEIEEKDRPFFLSKLYPAIKTHFEISDLSGFRIDDEEIHPYFFVNADLDENGRLLISAMAGYDDVRLPLIPLKMLEGNLYFQKKGDNWAHRNEKEEAFFIDNLEKYNLIYNLKNEAWQLDTKNDIYRFLFEMYKKKTLKQVQGDSIVSPQPTLGRPEPALSRPEFISGSISGSISASILNNCEIKLSKKLENLKFSNEKLLPNVEIFYNQDSNFFDFSVDYGLEKLKIPQDKLRNALRNKEDFIELEGEVIAFNREEYQRFEGIVKQWKRDFKDIDLETVKNSYFAYGLFEELSEIAGRINISKEAFEYFEKIRDFKCVEQVEPPENLKNVLRNYQAEGLSWLNFLKTYGFCGVLADDMGLGKTVQTLSLLSYLKQSESISPTIVVCPSSLIYNWLEEIKKFTPELSALTITGTKEERKKKIKSLKSYDLGIISYHCLKKDFKELSAENFYFIILDEAQYIKNYHSSIAHHCRSLVSKYRLAVTGTPFENNIFELWSIFNFLMPNYLHSAHYFRKKYFNPIAKERDINAQEKLLKRIRPFILRRKKHDVEKELPEKLEEVMFCQLSDFQANLYREYLEAQRARLYKTIDERGFANSRFSILTSLMRLRQICCHPWLIDETLKSKDSISGKFDLFCELLIEIIESGHRVLVFSQFVKMLKILRKFIEKNKYNYFYLDGSTKSFDRLKMANEFNVNDNIPVFLISLKAGGTGLNLTGADYVIHYDPWWNPAVENQATDRAHRIGQTKKVFSYKLITKNTIEEKVLNLQITKANLFNEIINLGTSFESNITRDDLEFLLS